MRRRLLEDSEDCRRLRQSSPFCGVLSPRERWAVYLTDDPGRAELIDGAIGEESPFHEVFGYYAHGVGPETVVLPAGWRGRAATIGGPATRGVTAVCPAPQDLAASKLVAGRARLALEALR